MHVVVVFIPYVRCRALINFGTVMAKFRSFGGDALQIESLDNEVMCAA